MFDEFGGITNCEMILNTIPGRFPRESGDEQDEQIVHRCITAEVSLRNNNIIFEVVEFFKGRSIREHEVDAMVMDNSNVLESEPIFECQPSRFGSLYCKPAAPYDTYFTEPRPISHSVLQKGDMWQVAAAAILDPKIHIILFYEDTNEQQNDLLQMYRTYKHVVTQYSNRVLVTRVRSARGAAKATFKRKDFTPFLRDLEEEGEGVNPQEIILKNVSDSTYVIQKVMEGTRCNAVKLIRAAWCTGLDQNRCRIIDQFVRSFQRRSVLFWIRKSDEVHPLLNMFQNIYDVIAGTLNEAQVNWFCVGNKLEFTKAASPTLLNFWDLPFLQDTEAPQGIVDRRYQVYMFDQFRKSGCISIGLRSGTLDGCSALIGMPTLALDNEFEDGYNRHARLQMLHPIFYLKTSTKEQFEKEKTFNLNNPGELKMRVIAFLQTNKFI